MSEKNKKIDKYHYHEFLDRCAVIQDNIEYFLREHPVANKTVIKKIIRKNEYGH